MSPRWAAKLEQEGEISASSLPNPRHLLPAALDFYNLVDTGGTRDFDHF